MAVPSEKVGIPATWEQRDAIEHARAIDEQIDRWGSNVAVSTSPVTLTFEQLEQLISVNATGGARTLNLPDATKVPGKKATFTKTDTSTNVITLDGFNVQTINGAATYTGLRKQYDSVTLTSNGTNWAITNEKRFPFVSADQAVASAGTFTLTHGLGVIPSSIEVWLRCVTGEFNYTAGQVVRLDGVSQAANHGLSLIASTTSIVGRYGSDATPLDHLDATTGASVALTNANWSVFIVAYA